MSMHAKWNEGNENGMDLGVLQTGDVAKNGPGMRRKWEHMSTDYHRFDVDMRKVREMSACDTIDSAR